MSPRKSTGFISLLYSSPKLEEGVGQYAFKGAIEMSRFCSVFRKGSPLPPLSVFQPFLLTFSHLPHPSAISSSFSGPRMSVCRPLCLASPSTFCHCTASPILAARDLFGQLSHRKRKKKKKEDQAMWDEEKVLAGNKRCSELFRHKQEVLKRGWEAYAGQ